MTAGFKYREVSNFPIKEVGETITTVTQLALPIPDSDDKVHTVFRFLGTSEHPSFYKWHVRHETERKMTVRFAQTIRKRVIVIEEFYIFLSRNGDYLYVNTKDRYCDEALGRLQKVHQNLEMQTRKVDLDMLKRDWPNRIRGGWFRNLDIADVSAVAIYGPNVTRSDEWERYEKVGRISSIHTEITYKGVRLSLLISRNRGVVIYGRLPEYDQLEILEELRGVLDAYTLIQ